MKLIVGLGNPGRQYQKTRHNIGFMTADWLSRFLQIPFDHKKKKNFYGRGCWQGHDILILKPQTFMNLSGESVLYVASFIKIPPEDIIVISDDFNLPFGRIRIRQTGSDGGHNGIRSVMEKLNTPEFVRVRIGIGGLEDDSFDASRFVLEKFSDEEMQCIPAVVKTAGEAVIDIISNSVEKAMNEYNGRPAAAAPGNN